MRKTYLVEDKGKDGKFVWSRSALSNIEEENPLGQAANGG